jgi:hypothetical protein
MSVQVSPQSILSRAIVGYLLLDGNTFGDAPKSTIELLLPKSISSDPQVTLVERNTRSCLAASQYILDSDKFLV